LGGPLYQATKFLFGGPVMGATIRVQFVDFFVIHRKAFQMNDAVEAVALTPELVLMQLHERATSQNNCTDKSEADSETQGSVPSRMVGGSRTFSTISAFLVGRGAGSVLPSLSSTLRAACGWLTLCLHPKKPHF